MRVLHIIPSAFEYFDDIRTQAFALVEELNTRTEMLVDVFTLQYESPSRGLKTETAEVAPSSVYSGSTSIASTPAPAHDYDLIHLHTPFLGGAKKILQWIKDFPEVPLVVTYYRQVELSDLFSYLILAYNAYYLPKIFSVAKLIILPGSSARVWGQAKKWARGQEKVVFLDQKSELKNYPQPLSDMEVVDNLVLLYNRITGG